MLTAPFDLVDVKLICQLSWVKNTKIRYTVRTFSYMSIWEYTSWKHEILWPEWSSLSLRNTIKSSHLVFWVTPVFYRTLPYILPSSHRVWTQHLQGTEPSIQLDCKMQNPPYYFNLVHFMCWLNSCEIQNPPQPSDLVHPVYWLQDNESSLTIHSRSPRVLTQFLLKVQVSSSCPTLLVQIESLAKGHAQSRTAIHCFNYIFHHTYCSSLRTLKGNNFRKQSLVLMLWFWYLKYWINFKMNSLDVKEICNNWLQCFQH